MAPCNPKLASTDETFEFTVMLAAKVYRHLESLKLFLLEVTTIKALTYLFVVALLADFVIVWLL